MSEHKPFKRKLFVGLVAVSLIPVGLALLASWFALREALTGAGTAGPWTQVGNSGGELLQLLEPYAAGDTALGRSAATHRQALSESVRFSLIYELLTERFLKLVPVLILSVGTLIVVFSTAAARRLARGLSRPIEELVGWTDRIARGEPLPPYAPARSAEVAEIVRLKEALRSMAERLDEARQQEIQAARLRSWSSVARRVAHEIKNPLTPIRFAATRVAREEDPGLQEAGRIILEEAGRLDEMARSFSQLGKLPEGPPSEVDLGELAMSLARAHSTDSIRVEAEVATEDPMIVGHFDSLERVFRNLLANALEAMEGAGRGGLIQIYVASPGPDVVEVSVRDQGPGLPPELKEGIWMRDFTTKRRGTGLGLALVKQTVELHGGWVLAQDLPGEGARFSVRLPRRPSGTSVDSGS